MNTTMSSFRDVVDAIEKKARENCARLEQHQQQRQAPNSGVTAATPYKCDHCGRCFSSCFALGGHVLSHYNKKPGGSSNDQDSDEANTEEYKCKICETNFNQGQALGGHMTFHRDKTVPTKKIHVSSSMSDLDLDSAGNDASGSVTAAIKKAYSCTKCNAYFDKPEALGGHMTKHRQKKHVSPSRVITDVRHLSTPSPEYWTLPEYELGREEKQENVCRLSQGMMEFDQEQGTDGPDRVKTPKIEQPKLGDLELKLKQDDDVSLETQDEHIVLELRLGPPGTK